MKFPPIKYTKGWDYVLAEEYVVETGIYPPKEIHHKDDFLLDTTGKLTIFKKYPWDGATGAFDTKNSMAASAVHDCFCEAMRTGELDYDKYSPLVHELLGNIAEDHGMCRIRGEAWKKATKFFRGGHPSHPDEHPVLIAP